MDHCSLVKTSLENTLGKLDPQAHLWTMRLHCLELPWSKRQVSYPSNTRQI